MTDTSFKVIKNVEENFSISLPDTFDENTPASGYMYAYPKFSYKTIITPGTPTLNLYPTVSVGISSPIMSLVETSLGHSYNATYINNTSANGGDCYLQTGVPSSFDGDSNYLYYGNGYTGSYKAWIPFELAPKWGTIARGTPIVFAVIVFFVKNVANESENVGIQIGCENLKATWDSSGYTTYPANYNDLNSRAMTNIVTILPSPMGLWGATGNTLIYDVTDSVQEAINGSFWSGGGGLAVMVWNYNSGTGGYNYCRRSYSMEGGEPPILQIGMN